MHRAVTLFVAAASRLDNRQTSSITSDTTDPSISDMEALAANMEDLARGLANLPTSLRTVAQGLRTDNATDFEALEVDFRNASSTLLRLGTAATRMSSARINWSTTPPRARGGHSDKISSSVRPTAEPRSKIFGLSDRKPSRAELSNCPKIGSARFSARLPSTFSDKFGHRTAELPRLSEHFFRHYS